MRTVLITGASDGIGAALAKRLAHDEFKVILCGRSEEKLASVASDCPNSQTLAFDINDTKARQAALGSVDHLDILINNAGIWQKLSDLENIDDDTISAVIQTDLISQILITKQLLPLMRGRKGTGIINVISKSGTVAQAGQCVYTAAKYGMRGFTDVLRTDLADDPIQIGAVYQSGTNTAMFKKSGEDFPIDSFMEPEDLAETIAHMLTRPDKLWLKEIHIEKY